jgi:8-oxo-dGTP diphosphatase
MISQPNAITLYTAVVLHHAQRYLLLRRAPTKRIAPNLWTGIGGRVEADELDNLNASVLREVAEETGLSAADIERLTLRRALLHNRPHEPLTLLLFFTGELRELLTPHCTEGALAWLTPEQLADLPMLETTRSILPLVIQDHQHDPSGEGRVRLGVAQYQADGKLERIVWASEKDEFRGMSDE